ncbi:MAG TPA: hypothetical protein VJR89_25755 [Polyangiales bacterium]|nr:hypothetical protein [Polyangiales bacterium]
MVRTGSALVVAVLAVAVSCKAGAQSVVVLAPPESDAELTDVAHRIEAELHLHGFEAIARSAGIGPNPAAALRGAAHEASAFAAIGFTRDAGEAAVHVWLIDQRSGAEAFRSLTLAPRTSDAPNLVAVRAVDLLRAATQDFPKTEPEPEPEPEVVAPSEAEPPETEAPDIPLPPERPWSIALSGTLQWAGSQYGLTYGPALGVFHRPLSYVQWGVWIGAPVLGQSITTPSGTASVHRGQVVAELRLRALRVAGFSLSPLAGAGMAVLQADGDRVAPLEAKSDAVFGAVAALGLHLEQRLGAGFGLGLSFRALAHLPALGVQVASAEAPLQQPVLEAALGVIMEL